MEALLTEPDPNNGHDAGMDEAKKHVRPGVPRDGPLGVVNDRRGSIDTKPVGAVRGLHGRNGGGGYPCLRVGGRCIEPPADVLNCVGWDAFGLKGFEDALGGASGEHERPEDRVKGSCDVNKQDSTALASASCELEKSPDQVGREVWALAGAATILTVPYVLLVCAEHPLAP
eukprot:15451023-Alexandrium_andersonii.AAC.1